MKLYTSVAKGLTLKARKFWGLISTFPEDTEEKLVAGGLFGPPSSIGLRKGDLKICSKFTGEHPCRSKNTHAKATLLKSHFGMGILRDIQRVFRGVQSMSIQRSS